LLKKDQLWLALHKGLPLELLRLGLLRGWTKVIRVDLRSGLRCSLACGTATKENMAEIDYDTVVHKAVQGIGYDWYAVYICAEGSKGLSYKTCRVSVRVNKQSPDIAEGVHVGKSEMDVAPRSRRGTRRRSAIRSLIQSWTRLT
jgi:predicted DNA-binding protein (MmcQ/YjbR family)